MSALPAVASLLAKSFCDGKRIDLSWVNPAGATQLKIRRSAFAYCQFTDDPGQDIYTGALISSLSDTGLQEGGFYYYTLFISYTGSPYVWLTDGNSQVEGLSLRDYYAAEGDYVYALLPQVYRNRDADPARGADRYTLKKYCRVLQCAVNQYRGWMEALIKFRDPDTMPAGRVGEAINQRGILEAHVWDLGVPPERSYDAGVLRRIALGIVPILQQKGTCPGLVALAKLFTGWDSRCEEAIMPICGVDQLFYVLDTSIGPYIDTALSAVCITPTRSPTHGISDPIITYAVGSATFTAGTIFLPDQVTPAAALPTVPPTVAFVIDSMGTYACVGSVAVAGGTTTLTFDNPNALLRDEILITPSSVGSATLTFNSSGIATASYPWQFPSSGGFSAPKFGLQAFAGMKYLDGANVPFDILSSTATDGSNNTVLTLSAGTPDPGQGSIMRALGALTGSFATRQPQGFALLYVGEYSLMYDPKWDTRLLAEGSKGPWSLITALGSPVTLGKTATPADVTIWVTGVAQDKGTSTAIASLVLTDSTKAWTVNQWAGYFLLPNWRQRKLFPIASNTATAITVTVPEGGDISTVSAIGNSYAILGESDALKHSRLYALAPSFVPFESYVFIKFE